MLKLKDYRKKIKEYHQYHKDRNIHIVGILYKSDFTLVVLVRVTDENGKKKSCIDMVTKETVSELIGGNREAEDSLIEEFKETYLDE